MACGQARQRFYFIPLSRTLQMKKVQDTHGLCQQSSLLSWEVCGDLSDDHHVRHDVGSVTIGVYRQSLYEGSPCASSSLLVIGNRQRVCAEQRTCACGARAREYTMRVNVRTTSHTFDIGTR